MKNEKNSWRHHFSHVYHKWQSYIWFLRYGAWRTEFFVLSDHFLNLYPTKNLENQNFEKLKKIPWRYYDFTNVYHKWQPYDIWFLRYGVELAEFFVILDNFYSFASLTTLKIKILKKWKKCVKILSFLHMCTRNDNHMMYGSWDMEFDR